MPNLQPLGQRALPDNQQPSLVDHELQSRLTDQKRATGQAIGLRRKQRWVFYAVIIAMFLVALFLIIKVYNDNSKLLSDIDNIGAVLTERQTDMDRIKGDLSSRDQQLQVAGASLDQVQTELRNKIDDLQIVVKNNDQLQADLSQINFLLASTGANVSNIMLQVAIRVGKAEADKIALADVTAEGLDSDGDGLSDALEKVLGTDIGKGDSDGDGYNDKDEMIGGFDPLGDGKLPLDNNTAKKYPSKFLLQDGQVAWYVAENGKKYFLGTLDDHFSSMRYSEYWTRD